MSTAFARSTVQLPYHEAVIRLPCSIGQFGLTAAIARRDRCGSRVVICCAYAEDDVLFEGTLQSRFGMGRGHSALNGVSATTNKRLQPAEVLCGQRSSPMGTAGLARSIFVAELTGRAGH